MTNGESFAAADVRITYDDLVPDREASGVGSDPAPVVLLHGFASSRRENWRERGWYETLLAEGRRVIALDCRGHGESGKPRDPEAYETATMADDVVALLDHLEVEEADLLGYSMGGRLSLELLAAHPERFNAGVLAGIGSASLSDTGGSDAIADALAADDLESVSNPIGRRFRRFAETTDNDLEALSACARQRTPPADWETVAGIDTPVSVVAGERDGLVGDPRKLADGFPNGEAVVVPDADHLTTVPDDAFEEAVVDFLEREGL
ncbi:alpha/beta fold hydrolase [Natrialbaceae archaeon GCM10025810]|uniref:alpha/beta fold hydrolase n=1 Tax=Halovalidus salilacus TaxID=3075124 RepID=UPI003607941C